MPAVASKTVFQLRISLKDYAPVIWRRLLVPGGITLGKLHRMIQAAMGWEDYHLRCLEIDGVRYGIPDPEFEITDVDDETALATAALRRLATVECVPNGRSPSS